MSKLIPIIVVAVIVAVGGGYLYQQNKNKRPEPIPDQVVPPSANPPARTPGATIIIDPNTAPQTSATYKDGTYKADGSYKIPEDNKSEAISISLTIKDGVVTDSTVSQKAADGKSVLYQEVFAAGYKELVVGKKLDTLKLDVVSGSSLTSGGFNEAVEKVKMQAKA